MAKYSLGIDFGSLSARAILVDVADGRQVATKSSAYKHAVIEEINGCDPMEMVDMYLSGKGRMGASQ